MLDCGLSWLLVLVSLDVHCCFVLPNFFTDNLKCVSRDPGLLLRAAWFTYCYVRLVGQEFAPSKCVLLRTSKVVRRDMRDWLLSQEGDKWSVRLDVRDLGSKGTQEAVGKVAKDEARRLSIVQTILLRSTHYLRRIIAPTGGQGGVTLSYLCPHCNSFPLEDCFWWVSAVKKYSSWWCAACGKI